VDPGQLTDQIGQAIDLSAEDIEVLERFAILLPRGWKEEVPNEGFRWFCVCRSGPATGVPPAIVVFRTNALYSVAISDCSEYLDEGNKCEIFECDNISEVVLEIRRLTCEFMQTEDPSVLTPSSWTRCLHCEPDWERDCLWINPEQGSGLPAGGSSQQGAHHSMGTASVVSPSQNRASLDCVAIVIPTI